MDVARRWSLYGDTKAAGLAPFLTRKSQPDEKWVHSVCGLPKAPTLLGGYAASSEKGKNDATVHVFTFKPPGIIKADGKW